jgi:hypothetical protein
MFRVQYAEDIRTEADNFRYRLQLALAAITTAVTVFAALPVFLESDIYKMVLLFVWIMDFIFNVSLFKVSFTNTSMVIIISWVLYMIYCVVMHIIRGDGYINGTYFYSVSLCVFVYINGCFLSHERTKKIFSILLTIYNVCSVIVLLSIYITNFWGIQYLQIETYVYAAKNSIGPMIVSNLIILAIQETRSNIFINIARFACQIFFVYLLLLVNNRAGVVELAVVLICYFFLADKSHRLPDAPEGKSLSVIYILVLCWAAFISMAFYGDLIVEKAVSFFNWALKLEQFHDLNSFSSGRISSYYFAINYAVKVSVLFGVGIWYTDLFYLSMLAEVGLIGSIPIFIILTMLFTAVKNIRSKNNYIKLLGLLAVQTLTATFFEGLPPFGPGTVVFIFWLLFGAYEGSEHIEKRLYPV